MTDRKWIKAYYDNGTYICQHTSFSLDELTDKFGDLMIEATSKGFIDCKLMVESTIEPYETYPGDVKVTVSGKRLETNDEVKFRKRQDRIEKLAKERGITPYDAGQLLSMSERGLIKLD